MIAIHTNYARDRVFIMASVAEINTLKHVHMIIQGLEDNPSVWVKEGEGAPRTHELAGLHYNDVKHVMIYPN